MKNIFKKFKKNPEFLNFLKIFFLHEEKNKNKKQGKKDYSEVFFNKIMIFLIEIYQKIFSKDHGPCATGFCKFIPSCSEYSKESFKKYFFLKAFLKMIWRILRCNPFNKNGGIDLP